MTILEQLRKRVPASGPLSFEDHDHNLDILGGAADNIESRVTTLEDDPALPLAPGADQLLISNADGSASWNPKDFSDDQVQKLKGLVAEEATLVIAKLLGNTVFEKGAAQSISVKATLTQNDETILSFNRGGTVLTLNNVSPGVSDDTHIITGVTNSTTISYSATRTDYKGDPASILSKSMSFTAYIPQFYGMYDQSDLTYSSGSIVTASSITYLTKTLQSSGILSLTIPASSNKYIYFISKSSFNLCNIGGFDYSIADWGNAGFLWRKQITLTLNDNSTQTMYLYRSADLQSPSSNQLITLKNG